MTPLEFVDLQEALIYVFAPILRAVSAIVLAEGIMAALLALGIELVTHRRRKTPSM